MRIVLPSSLLLAALAGAAQAQDFRVIALPDTQKYTESYPELFIGQTQWIADRLVPDNIRFVTHLGDLVEEAATIAHWNVATNAMSILDGAGVPYGTCVGNHDVRYPGEFFDPTGVNYRTYFGPQFYEGEPWFGGASPSGLSNYQVIEVDGVEYLFLHLQVETPAPELAWAQGVLNENRDKPTWLSTHRYLFDWIFEQGRYDEFNYFFEPPYVPNGISADELFNNFVAANRQVYVVHCGHNDGEYRQTSTNNFGLPVHEILADYQNTFGNGGNGWLRVMDFRPGLDRIDVTTYSPTLNSFMTDEESQFTLSVDFEDYVADRPFLRFQEGLGGYGGTRDTWISEADPNSSYGGSDQIVVDCDVNNNIFTDYAGQGLIRFEDLFRAPVLEGEGTPTRIPLGAVIERALLTVTLAEDTDLGDPQYRLFRMTRSWDEGSTWNSLGNGIGVGSDTDPQLVSFFTGDNDPDLEFGRTVDVASAVQAWSQGAPNHGLAILPEPLPFFDDGIAIRSSEDGNSALRPVLDVEFSYEVLNVPPTIDAFLTASALVVVEGDEVELSFAATDPNPLDPLTFRINGQDVGFATGSGVTTHPVLFEDDGVYTFTAEVLDDEVSVAAGEVEIEVLNRAPWLGRGASPVLVGTRSVPLPLVIDVQDAPFDRPRAAWELDGDGRFDDLEGFEGHWTFHRTGSHRIQVLLSDEDGGQAVHELMVRIRP